MKGILTLKKLAVIVAVCMAVLCLPVYSEPTPEQVAEREQEKVLKGGETMIEKFLHNGKYLKIYGENADHSYISVASIYSIYITENSVVIHRDIASGSGSLKYDVYEYLISLDKDCNLIIKPEARQKTKKELEVARKKEQLKKRKELLLEAIKHNDVERAKLCIKLGADVNAKVYLVYQGGIAESESSYFVTTNRDKAVERHTNLDSCTLLTYTVKYRKSKDIVELLIKSGADINAKYKSKTVARHIIDTGDKDMAKLLINSGADLNAKDDAGETALMIAASHGNKDIAEMLIKAGADVNAKNNGDGTALSWAIINEKKDVVEMLIKEGADKNAALIKISETGQSDGVKFLIDAGADVNAKDSEGVSVLTHAILYGKKDIAKLLRSAGAKE